MKARVYLVLLMLCVALVGCGSSHEEVIVEEPKDVDVNGFFENGDSDASVDDSIVDEILSESVEAEDVAKQPDADNGIDQSIFKIVLCGVEYQLPVSFEDMASNGWEYAEGDEPVFPSGEQKYKNFVNGDVKVSLLMFNPSKDALPITGCAVGGIVVENYLQNSLDNFSFAGGLNPYSTREEVMSVLGNQTETDEKKDKYYDLYYRYSKTYDNGVEYIMYDDGKVKVKVTNAKPDFELAGGAGEIADTGTPAYLDEYMDPGIDTRSGIKEEAYFTLDGDTYCLPCPVTEFEKNGWSVNCILKESDSIGGLAEEQFVIKKGSMSANVIIYNFDNKQHQIEDCAVRGIIVTDKIKFDYFGISINTSDKDVRSIIGDDSNFEINETDDYTSFRYGIKRSDGKKIFSAIQLRDGRVERIDVSSDTWVY